MRDSIAGALARRAAAHPQRLALIAGEQRVTYGELWRRANAVAGELERRGVQPGERVLLSAPSTPSFACGYLGVHLSGAVAVPLDPHAPPARRDDLTRRTAPRHVFGPADLEELPERQRAAVAPPGEALADLLFTTGTTGRSKGVRLTHANLSAAAAHINAVIGNGEGDVEVMPLPLYHSFGLGRLRCNLLAGGTLVLVDGFRLPGEIFAALERHRATGLVGVPAAFALLLRFGAQGLGAFSTQLRYIEIGSAPMPLEHKRALRELLPDTALWMHYGLTEASRSAFIEFHRHRAHLDTVGRAAPGVRFSIRDDGLLWIGGAHVSPGYWDDDELAARTFAPGWVCSGDVAHLDGDGFLTLRGRKDDMINVGGFNVSPDEIERALREHPAVQDAGCVGLPDPRGVRGETVVAFLVRSPRAVAVADEELAQWLSARLEPYKLPERYCWTDELPRTESGKLLRRKLRERMDKEVQTNG